MRCPEAAPSYEPYQRGHARLNNPPNQAHTLSDSIDPIGDEQEQGEEAGGFTPSE
jgi:hypothetical protein